MALFNKKSAAPQQKSADFALLPNHVGIIMDGNGRWALTRKMMARLFVWRSPS